MAGDAEVSGDANGSEMAQEADNDAGELPFPLPSLPVTLAAVWTLCGLTWRQLAVSPMSVHAPGLATLKSMLHI